MKTVFVEFEIPDWANWVAIDRDGSVNVFSSRPKAIDKEEAWFLSFTDDDDLLWEKVAHGIGHPNDWNKTLKRIKK